MRLSGTKTGSANQYRGLGNQLWDLAGNRPSLDLRFAESKSLVDATTGTNLVDFTRASSGTYVGSDGLIKTATTNEPRFDHDPTTGESLGLLVEEQRTNLSLRSEEFRTTWTPTGLLAFGSGSIADAIASPAGTQTADKLVEDTSTGTHEVSQTIAVTSGTFYTISIFVKAAEKSILNVLLGEGGYGVNVNANFNLTLGTATISIFGTNTSASISAYPNGWYRCILTSQATASASVLHRIRLTDSSGVGNYTGDGTSGLFLWGAQLEAGSFPTSYIPTEGSAVTRAADVASINGSNFSSWYRQDEGTVFAEFRDSIGTQSEYPFALSDNTINNRFVLFTSGSSTLNSRLVSAGSAFNPGNLSFSASSLVRACITAKAGVDQAITACNGLLSTTGSPVSMPAIDRMYVGGAHNGLEPTNGTIRRLVYWKQRLPNETLQTITQ